MKCKPVKIVNKYPFAILFLALFTLYNSTVKAQMSQLKKGDRIRITAPIVQSDQIRGDVTMLSESVIVLTVKDSLFYISKSLIQRLEISTGKKRTIGRGFLIGVFAGAWAFGAVAALANNQCGSDEMFCNIGVTNGDAFLSGGLTGIVTGGVIGAITGIFVRVDQWERVPLYVAADFTHPTPEEFVVGPGLSIKIRL